MNIVIEVDGESHNSKIEYDFEREQYLKSLGLEVIKITAKEVLKEMDGVVQFLEAQLIKS